MGERHSDGRSVIARVGWQRQGPHDCDLFLMTGHFPYVADRLLPEFARIGRPNIDGWGIGCYVNGIAKVVRSDQPATQSNGYKHEVSSAFLKAVEATSSPITLGHLRSTSSGETRVENNHPFKLSFLGYDWLLIHNGTGRDDLIPRQERLLLESNSDTPRIFEFLRKEIINLYLSDTDESLINACSGAFRKLLLHDPYGSFNIIMSNGYLSFVFVHWRPFYILAREKTSGDVAFVTTIERLTRQLSQEEWKKIDCIGESGAVMLVFSGPTLAYREEVFV